MSDTETEVLSEFLVFPTNYEEESHKWTHQNTLIFLELYKKYRQQVGSLRIKNLKKMFEEIAKEMKRITKTGITGTNCENRWKVLERNYKKFIDNSKLTGRGRKVFEYAEIMDSILGHKKNIHPVLLLSSHTINTPSEASADDKENELEMGTEPNVQEMVETQTETVRTPKRKTVTNIKENKRLKSVILREIRNDRKEYYQKRLDIEMNKLSEQKRRNDLLAKHNVLLEKYLEKNSYTPMNDF